MGTRKIIDTSKTEHTRSRSSTNTTPIGNTDDHDKKPWLLATTVQSDGLKNIEYDDTKDIRKRSKILSYWEIEKSRNFNSADGTIEFRACPSLSEKQQCLLEYSLPIILPAMFSLLNFSSFGLRWCLILVVGHTVETTFTDFGSSVGRLRLAERISPLAHHLIDCAWLHSLISAMLLTPHFFIYFSTVSSSVDKNFDGAAGSSSTTEENEWRVVLVALLLIQTLPIYLAVSFKTEYLKRRGWHAPSNFPSTSLIGLHIRRCFLWYLKVTACIFIACYFHLTKLLQVCVFVLNLIPIGLFFKYSTQYN
uniref:Uncharacterized protein n=2 Tax=Corethron hystrix TaxID=216773 RepID=A0A7S1FWP4_9STRA|mmetsp:Transcript_3373/g.6219  ORF Transcript_3373/g.6219 Transcript_3373/m.6219 type:complete len:307 (+) Transcript_3373:167-1087(+)